MNQPLFRFERVRLDDASRIKQAGLETADARTVKTMRQTLQMLSDRCGRLLWLMLSADSASDEAQDKPDALRASEKIVAIVGFQVIDPLARRAVVLLIPGESILSASFFTSIMDQGFSEAGLFRLELEVGVAENSWKPALEETGWRQEAVLTACRWNQTRQRHEDVWMYSLLRPQQRSVGVAFIPFTRGVVTLAGDDHGVSSSAFARYGHSIQAVRIHEAAEFLGLLDDQGKLMPEEQMTDQAGDQGWIGTGYLPQPIIDAAGQIVAYFHGKRTNMDIKVHFEQGSPFQQRVWSTLRQIPFGTTWTYEDLASLLCDQDRVQGRKMARAVGAACGANPLPLILPCHRVIGKNGHLVGFSGGLDIKEYLLSLELLGLNEWKVTTTDE